MSNSSKTLTFAWHILCISVCVPQFLLFLLILFNLGFFWATFLKIMKSRKDTCKTTAVPSLQSMYRYMYITPVHAYSHKDNRGHSLISFTHSIPVLPFFSSLFWVLFFFFFVLFPPCFISSFYPVSFLRECLHDTCTSFIPLQNLILYRIYMGVIVPEWHEVSCKPSFLQAILECCWLLTHMRYPSQSAQPLISYQNETLYLLYVIPVQNVARFHTSTNVSYWYENRSELVTVWLVPVPHSVPVSCKRIQSYKWAPRWTRTRMKLIPI